MKQSIYTITENRRLAAGIYRMTLAGDGSAVTAPGQFINIRLDGHFLRRPISVCDAGEGFITIIYKVLGEGTREMTAFEPSKELDVLAGLGNGFDITKAGPSPLLIGGGVGIPPLYLLAKKLKEAGTAAAAVLGFNSKDDAFYIEEFKELCSDVRVTSADGSLGTAGFVTDALPESASCFYTCGPTPMLRAVYDKANALGISGQLSFEERMGCGFGACMGCSVRVKGGSKRVCKDGPVFEKEEILWEK